MAEIKKTMLSVDGNTAAAIESYNLLKWLAFTQSLHLPQWQNKLISMPQREKRTTLVA